MGKILSFSLLVLLYLSPAALYSAANSNLTVKQTIISLDLTGSYRLVSNNQIGFLDGKIVSAHLSVNNGCVLAFDDMKNALLRKNEVLAINNADNRLEQVETCAVWREEPGGNDYCEKPSEPEIYSLYRLVFTSALAQRTGVITCRQLSATLADAKSTFYKELDSYFNINIDSAN